MTEPTTSKANAPAPARPANRLGLEYAAEAARMPARPTGIIDVHTHINGAAAAEIYARVTALYGVRLTYSMTQLEDLDAVRGVLGDRIRFIAVPNYIGEDRLHHHGPGFIERIRQFHEQGVRIVKFWAAPRGVDYGQEVGDPGLLRLDAPMRVEAMEVASDLGMVFMTHVGDPDTWFATKYADESVYGSKAAQYEPLEILLDRFTQPWIGAHLGGWPEDLEFLTGLMERHDNLYLDTSAAKWMVRELSSHDRDAIVTFLRRFSGRVMFGTDIVTSDEHLHAGEKSHDMMKLANSPDEAFELYASRYWVMRALFETDYRGPSPIADPDLALVEPDKYTDLDAPPLAGKALPDDVLDAVYFDAAHTLLDSLHAEN
jgi:hypothetical protein